MRCCADFPRWARKRSSRPERSANVQQLSLIVLENESPESRVWEQMSKEQQESAVEILARLIAQAVISQPLEAQNRE